MVAAGAENGGARKRKADADAPADDELWDAAGVAPVVTRPAEALEPWERMLPQPVRRKNAAKTLRPEPSLAPPVEVPQAGASYHPSDDAHQQLLRAAVDVEKKRAARLAADIQAAPRNMSQAAAAALARAELDIAPHDRSSLARGRITAADFLAAQTSAGGDGDSGDSDRDDATGADGVVVVRNGERKTKKQRRTEQRLKDEAAARAAAKAERRLLDDLSRVKSIKRELLAEERARAARQAERTTARTQRQLTVPRVLGPRKFTAPTPAVQLSSELAGSLRQLKPEGNLLSDRLVSLQRRNIIEARVPTR